MTYRGYDSNYLEAVFGRDPETVSSYIDDDENLIADLLQILFFVLLIVWICLKVLWFLGKKIYAYATHILARRRSQYRS